MKARLCTIALWIAIPVYAQQHTHHHAGQDTSPTVLQQQTPSPYAGMQGRAIKALSEQQAADLRAGKGMSLALAAELNGYPGPAHVLELAEPLVLGEEQKRKTQMLFEQMQSEAKALGESVIAGEYELDRLFREKTASVASAVSPEHAGGVDACAGWHVRTASRVSVSDRGAAALSP